MVCAKKHIFTAFVLFLFTCSFSQNKTLDSLVDLLNNTPSQKNSNISDTSRLRILELVTGLCSTDDIFKYANQSIELSDKIINNISATKNNITQHKLLGFKVRAINSIGYYNSLKGNNAESEASYERALKISKEIGDKQTEATVMVNIGALQYNIGDYTKALQFYNEGLKILEGVDDNKVAATVLMNMAVIYKIQGDLFNAFKSYNKSLDLFKKINYQEGIAYAYANLASLYEDQGDIVQAILCNEKSIKIRETVGDLDGVASSLNNIGHIYQLQGDVNKALEYYNKSLTIRQKLNNKKGIQAAYNNIGQIFGIKKDYGTALFYFNKCLALAQSLGDKQGLASAYNSIGGIYNKTNRKDSANWFFEKSLILQKEIGNKKGIANEYLNISSAHLNNNKIKLASAYIDSSLFLAHKLGFPALIKSAERVKSKIDSTNGNFEGALDHYKKYIFYRDSINNVTTRKASVKSQLKYEFEKKEAIILEQQEKEKALANEQSARQQIIIWSVTAGMLLVIAFAFFVFRNLKIARKQKLIIENHQKEILDSIHYAKRIQNSLLPTHKFIERILNSQNKN